METTTKPTYNDVLDFIRYTMTQEQCPTLTDVLNVRIKSMRKAATIGLYNGKVVEWTSKHGFTERGIVTKVGRTRAHVTTNTGARWYVSSSLLREVK